MSLATRCTACGTVFRVVQDQLKVSEGWVRCGRCNEVFNALEGLFDLERDTPPDWPASANDEPAGPSPAAPLAERIEVEEALPLSDAQASHDKIDAPAMSPHDSGQHSTPAGRVSERDRLEFPDAQFDPDMLAEDTVQLRSPTAVLESSLSGRGIEVTDDAAAPEFIRHAQLRARWQSPVMRALLAISVLVLVAVLALQSAHHYRNLIAAKWPDAAPALAAWCGAMVCAIEAPSRIEDVAVESTALTRAGAPDAFKLAVVLRNRGTISVALPSVDLTLTDASGQLVARRMLAPRDFRAASTVMKPGGESALQLTFTAGNARVTGYTVEVFYP